MNPPTHAQPPSNRAPMPEEVGLLCVPQDHIGPYFLSGLGRMIWWTGRVAIGLRYQPPQARSPDSRS